MASGKDFRGISIHAVSKERHRTNSQGDPTLNAPINEVHDGNTNDNLAQSHSNRISIMALNQLAGSDPWVFWKCSLSFT